MCCLVALSHASTSRKANKSDKTFEAVVEDEVEDTEVLNCEDDNSSDCDSGNVMQVEDDEEEAVVEEETDKEIVEKPVVQQKLSLKDGKSCRLKTEGEKLSKIIRKVAKPKKEKAMLLDNEEDEETANEKVEVQQKKAKTTEKREKMKRDVKSQDKNVKRDSRSGKKADKSSKSKKNQKKSKGNVKSSKDGKNHGKSSKGNQKSSKKNQKYSSEL